MRLPSVPAIAGTEGSRITWPPPVQPLQVKGPKGSALGGDPRGRAPWWGFRGKAPDLASFTRLPWDDTGRGLPHAAPIPDEREGTRWLECLTARLPW